MDDETRRALVAMAEVLQNAVGGDGATVDQRALPTGTPTTNLMAGPGGIFGVPGLEAGLIHTMISPVSLAGAIPAAPDTNRMNPLIPYLTGVTGESGDVANGVCDDPQTAGNIKSCLGTALFGRYSHQTKELELDRLGQQTNRGEFQDIRILNTPLMEILKPITPDLPAGVDVNAVLSDFAMAFMAVGLAFQRELCVQVFTGNPANNSAGGGYKEFNGIQRLVRTGHVDAISGTACPSLDSDIKQFGYQCIDTAAGGQYMVRVMAAMFRYVKNIAERTGLTPVDWRWVMRPDLFYELTQIWPCNYLTYRCIVNAAAGDRVVVDPGDAIAMRDQMRNGNYLVVDGFRMPVVLDSCLPEETDADTPNLGPGQFASDIFLMPFTAMGGTPTFFWEFRNYTERYGAWEAIQAGNLGGNYWASDGGRYLWHNKPPLNWCVQWLAKVEPRLRLLTPHIAGRIQNVCYQPLQHTRDPLPEQPYFVDGGLQTRPSPSLYGAAAV